MTFLPRGTDAIALTPRANVEEYRALAADLLHASRSDDRAAVERWATGWMARLASLSPLPPGASPAERSRRPHRIEAIVRDVERSPLAARDGDEGASLDDAQLTLARLHGFESWSRLVHHLEECGDEGSATSRFERAADAIVDGELDMLRELVSQDPAIVRARSTRDHRATLLHYIAANGHEGFRQRTPPNAEAIARFLLESGGDPDALAHMYAHEVTTMQMLVSSVHPHAAGVQVALVDVLLRHGAAPDGPDGEGSPVLTAFRFHYPRAAEALVRGGARADTVMVAAPLGRAEVVDRLIAADGTLHPAPRATGPWPRLSDDPREHLAQALTWACTFGRTEVVDVMLRKGVDPEGEDADASGLHFAAAYGHLDIVELLVRHGASLEKRNSYGGTVLDGMVWYALNGPIDGVDYSAIAQRLLALGARTDVYPEMHGYVELVLGGQRGGGYPDVEGQG